MNIILMELLLVTAVALGLGFWQLYDVNKELKKEQDKDANKPAPLGQAPDDEQEVDDQQSR